MSLAKISPSNKSLQFIEERLKSDDYRGMHLSQHNRYEKRDISIIMALLNKHMPQNGRMHIRTTDLSKRPLNTDAEKIYEEFCSDVARSTGRQTQDTIRKNIFVDLHRMNFIERWDKSHNKLEPFKQGSTRYVSISKTGHRFLDSNAQDSYFIYTKGIDNLLGGCINTFLNILTNQDDYGINRINIHDFMFFISAIGTKTSFNITESHAVALMKEFGILAPSQRKFVLETLAQELKPANYQGTKKDERDFHNWKNEAQQIFSLLHQTIHFNVKDENLALSGSKSIWALQGAKRLNRSEAEKIKYLSKHGIGKGNKKDGFELHHIVPLSWSESLHHFKMLDKWENMLYIDGYSHAKITQNRNLHVIMKFLNGDISLSSLHDAMKLKNKENVLYSAENKEVMQSYNETLLGTIDMD